MDLASRNAHKQEAPVCRNPELPPDHPGAMQERPHAMTEIDIAYDQGHAERGGTAATDLQLESEQSDLPREWPMARLAISNKEINRLVRTCLWRRVTEKAFRGFSFGGIPDEI